MAMQFHVLELYCNKILRKIIKILRNKKAPGLNSPAFFAEWIILKYTLSILSKYLYFNQII